MGGLGRTINASHAEYTRAPASNVAIIESDLPWAELAAIPETYATAWTCLFRNLKIKKGQLLLIGGATVKPAKIFGFDEIREAHRIMEANEAVGKMVVVRA